MPKPKFGTKPEVSSKAKGRNPFSSWVKGREERKRQAKNAAAKAISEKTAENENIMIDLLRSIDFRRSRLPKEVLERRLQEDQPCGDLEYASKALVQFLVKNPQHIKMDIRKIDEKLYTLVEMFKQSVEQGDENAAYAAKAGLLQGVSDIRSRIPQNQPNLGDQFVERNAEYLEGWITLVGIAQVADRMKQNVESERVLHQEAEDNKRREIEELMAEIETDPVKAMAYEKILKYGQPEHRSQWGTVDWEVFQAMLQMRLSKVHVDLSGLRLHQEETLLEGKLKEVEMLRTKLAALPISADPDLMNKYQEQIDELFKELAASDQEIDELLQSLDDIEGRLNQLDNAPGAVRAREVATEQAEVFRNEANKIIASQVKESKAVTERRLKEMGFYTEEDINRLQEEANQREQEALEELRKEANEAEETVNEVNQESEEEFNYNTN